VDQIPRAVQGQVEKVMNVRNERNNIDVVCRELDLNVVMGRQVSELSGMPIALGGFFLAVFLSCEMIILFYVILKLLF
jgi:translation initiation factor RLI1